MKPIDKEKVIEYILKRKSEIYDEYGGIVTTQRGLVEYKVLQEMQSFLNTLEVKEIEDEIEIPFGAKDSELTEVTYYIPKGFHAEIDDDKVVIKIGENKPIMNVPTREVILSIWDLGNEWKELNNGSISTKYGTQLDYIQKHWHESEYYLREKQGEKKSADNVEPKFKVGDIVKFDRPSAMLKREILNIDFENERYLTRRTDIGGAIKEFIYFCEQDDYVIVGSHNNLSIEVKVSILADEIIALKQRVKALEIQVIKDMSTPPLTQVYSCPDRAGDNVTLENMKS